MSSLSEENLNPAQGGARDFQTTHWSLVLQAAQGSSTQAGEALEKLCRAYWYPLYAYVRRRGYDVAEAQDLTQEYFSRLLAKQYLATIDPDKGRFRSFLLTSMKHFLANEWDRAHRQKRGGGCVTFSIEEAAAEERYQFEPAHEESPEKIFDRRWAQTVLEVVLTRLEQEFSETDKTDLFNELKACLTGDPDASSYVEVAARLGMTESAVKSAAHRLRQRYGELLREEIGQTVASGTEIDEEIRDLCAALAG